MPWRSRKEGLNHSAVVTATDITYKGIAASLALPAMTKRIKAPSSHRDDSAVVPPKFDACASSGFLNAEHAVPFPARSSGVVMDDAECGASSLPPLSVIRYAVNRVPVTACIYLS